MNCLLPCALQWSQTPAVCSQNARSNHRSPGWEAGAASVRDVHPHRRERPQDRSGLEEKLPPQLQHRQRCLSSTLGSTQIHTGIVLHHSFLCMLFVLANRFAAQSLQRLYFQQRGEAAFTAEVWCQNHFSRSVSLLLNSPAVPSEAALSRLSSIYRF